MSIREKLERLKNSSPSPERLKQRRKDRNTLLFLIFCFTVSIIFPVIVAVVRPNKNILAVTASILIFIVMLVWLIYLHFNFKRY